jgi:hypothetical protein
VPAIGATSNFNALLVYLRDPPLNHSIVWTLESSSSIVYRSIRFDLNEPQQSPTCRCPVSPYSAFHVSLVWTRASMLEDYMSNDTLLLLRWDENQA